MSTTRPRFGAWVRWSTWLLGIWFGAASWAAGPERELLGRFEARQPMAVAFDQALGPDGTLVLRWPGFIEADGTELTVSFESTGRQGVYRSTSDDDRNGLTWARYQDDTLSSYRLVRTANGGFLLEAVHRAATAAGLQVRWILIRDGSIVDRGALEAPNARSDP